jgi:lipoprotein-releasing system ATP-binding protein
MSDQIPQPAPILVAEQLVKSYKLGRVNVEVLKGVDLVVAPREMVAVIGASGSGKSTLLHLLGALDQPDSGAVRFDGQDINRLPGGRRDRLRNSAFGFVFQFYHLLPELTVVENAMLPAMVGLSAGGWISQGRARREQVCELLDQLGLSARLKHRPVELSGGERQRVAIARALINQPRILFADEPTGNLDAATGESILQVLIRLNRKLGQTLVMVTHDPKIAAHADRTVELVNGKVREK